ncbi:MAG: hypothetical protein GEV13_03095 [Rhodospirillales bacterium]|nr:hypothetical protein [Rhodospirillales bacterium]
MTMVRTLFAVLELAFPSSAATVSGLGIALVLELKSVGQGPAQSLFTVTLAITEREALKYALSGEGPKRFVR